MRPYVFGVLTALGLAGFCWGVWWLLRCPIRLETALAGSAVVGWTFFYKKGRDA